MTRRRRQQGFTLIETIVAFAIATTALVLLYQVHAGATAMVANAREHLYATQLAESILADIDITERAVSLERSGTDAGRYRWTARIEPYRNGAETGIGDDSGSQLRSLRLRRATIEVTWTARDRERSVTLDTLRPLLATEDQP